MPRVWVVGFFHISEVSSGVTQWSYINQKNDLKYRREVFQNEYISPLLAKAKKKIVVNKNTIEFQTTLNSD